ncbi:sensor histidine kinase [Foetidibacter luteolus]|uniref:sensor histidine kinase n=1 Tax=Foetidibacter luteolus TaxID=2608880 RepID=UPI00129AEE6D|nr:histidine kinase [Foetidibacter luteolus]
MHRLLVLIPVGLLYTTIVIAAGTAIRTLLLSDSLYLTLHVDTGLKVNNNAISLGLWGYAFFISVFIFFFFLVVYDIFYHYARLRHAEKENELLEKEKLRAELNQLKGVVNPHFLFNNLNSLSSLIAESPPQAELFLDELTKVFRYLLRNNQTELASLAQELDFIQSYYHMLRIRYGMGININFQVSEQCRQLMLPPLTLQLLVENAVKHNRVHKDNPLMIELSDAGGQTLVVRNNVSKKEGRVESTGIGLQTINARYKMLGRAGITVQHTEHFFEVTIPLIEVVEKSALPPVQRPAVLAS